MSSRTLAQDDFSLLELPAGQDANRQQHGFESIVRAASGDSMKSEILSQLVKPTKYLVLLISLWTRLGYDIPAATDNDPWR